MTRYVPWLYVLAVLLLGTAMLSDGLSNKADGNLTVYEDGSGVLRDSDGKPLITYDENTFEWDCSSMGNRRCG